MQSVGRRLTSAQPKEFAIGNIVRRVLGLIREELEEDRDAENSGRSDSGSENYNISKAESHRSSLQRPLRDSRRPATSPFRHGINEAGFGSIKEGQSSQASALTSSKMMFNLLSHPHPESSTLTAISGTQSPSHQLPLSKQALANLDAADELRAEVVEGILEIIQELKQADEQIASYAPEHIHSNEIVLTHSFSDTIHKFLLKAASRRKFTVLCAETYPNESEATYATLTSDRKKATDDATSDRALKSLTAAGVTVVLIPDSAVFAVMSRVNKIILDTHVVMSNGGLIAMAGAKQIAQAAKMHRTPVVVLSGVYKLSPVYPFDVSGFFENADPSKTIPYEDREFSLKIAVENPLFDYVPADLVDIYITNL